MSRTLSLGTARVTLTMLLISVTMISLSPLPAQASSPTVDMSNLCGEAIDVTDSGHDVWVLCNGATVTSNNVVEIDAHSGKILRNINLPKSVALPKEIVSNSAYVWVLNAEDLPVTAVQLSAVTGKVVRLIGNLGDEVT